MTRWMPLLIAILTLAVAVPARAQHMNEKDSPCAEVVVTVDAVKCLAAARDAADAKLNTVYKNARGKLDAAEVQQLVAAQHFWIQYRDVNCSAERDLYGGGTAAGPAWLACLEAMTRARTKELTVTYTVRLK